MVSIRRLQRHGNSTLLSLPRSLLRVLGWRKGDHVVVAEVEGRLVARKMDDRELIGANPAAVAAATTTRPRG